MGDSRREAMNPAGPITGGAKIPPRAPPGAKNLGVRCRSRRIRTVTLKSSSAFADGNAPVSARKLAAKLWRRPQQPPDTELVADADGVNVAPLGRWNELGFQDEPSPELESEIEGTAKWSHVHGESEQTCDLPEVLALRYELEQAQERIRELEEARCCCSNEGHEYSSRKTFADIRAKLAFERRARKRMERANLRLADELTEAKLSLNWLVRRFETERKNRELMEELCKEQAMRIKEAEALRRTFMKLREEAEEEREMLQVAEAFREEQVQMKLLDARLALDEKYSQLGLLVANLERFLGSKCVEGRITREAGESQEAAQLVNIRGVKESSYEPQRPNDLFQEPDEDTGHRKNNSAEIEPVLVSSPASVLRDLNAIITHESDQEDHKDILSGRATKGDGNGRSRTQVEHLR